MTQNGQPDATEGQTGILPEGSQGAPGPDSEGAAAPEGVKMVPATDLARVHGEKGSLQQALKTSEARTAELETQLSARENGGPPTDDERLRFEQEARELREERRETQRLLNDVAPSSVDWRRNTRWFLRKSCTATSLVLPTYLKMRSLGMPQTHNSNA